MNTNEQSAAKLTTEHITMAWNTRWNNKPFCFTGLLKSACCSIINEWQNALFNNYWITTELL